MSLKNTAHKKRRLNPTGAFTKFFMYATMAIKWVNLPKGGNHSMLAQSPVLRGFELFKGVFSYNIVIFGCQN